MPKKPKTLPPPVRYAIRKVNTQTFKVSGPGVWGETSLGGAKLYATTDKAQDDCDYLNDLAAYCGLKNPLDMSERQLTAALKAASPTYEVVTVNLSV